MKMTPEKIANMRRAWKGHPVVNELLDHLEEALCSCNLPDNMAYHIICDWHKANPSAPLGEEVCDAKD